MVLKLSVSNNINIKNRTRNKVVNIVSEYARRSPENWTEYVGARGKNFFVTPCLEQTYAGTIIIHTPEEI